MVQLYTVVEYQNSTPQLLAEWAAILTSHPSATPNTGMLALFQRTAERYHFSVCTAKSNHGSDGASDPLLMLNALLDTTAAAATVDAVEADEYTAVTTADITADEARIENGALKLRLLSVLRCLPPGMLVLAEPLSKAKGHTYEVCLH